MQLRVLADSLKNLRHRGAWQLCLYSFLGLFFINPQPKRGVILIIAHCVLYGTAVYPHAPGEREPLSYYWSRATTVGVLMAGLLSGASISNELVERVSSHSLSVNSIVAIVPSLVFSFLIALCIYVRILLYPVTRERTGGNGHQVRENRMMYINMFSGLAQCVSLIFAVTLIGQHIGLGTTNQSVIHIDSSNAVNLILWDFYCLAGMIVWMLRPFIAKAVEIRDNHLD